MPIEPICARSHLRLFREDIPPVIANSPGNVSDESIDQSRMAAAPSGAPNPTENPSIARDKAPTASNRTIPPATSSHPAMIGNELLAMLKS